MHIHTPYKEKNKYIQLKDFEKSLTFQQDMYIRNLYNKQYD